MKSTEAQDAICDRAALKQGRFCLFIGEDILRPRIIAGELSLS